MSGELVVADDDVSAFRENFKLLTSSIATVSDPAATLEKIWSWVTWIRGCNGSQAHNNHFFKVCLFTIAKSILKRRDTDDDHARLCQSFLQYCLQASSDHIMKDINEVTRLTSLILEPMSLMYFLCGRPKETVAIADEDDTSWADGLNERDMVDFQNDAGQWVKATLLSVSPTHTEFEVKPEGDAPMWLSIDDNRIAPIGSGGKSKASDKGGAAPVGPDPSTEEWRWKLQRGDMCDGMDSIKKWYQCAVVETKEEEGVASLKLDFIGWGWKFYEWIPRASPRLAKLNTRSLGKRGNLVQDTVEIDQELVVENDEADPEGIPAVLRPGVFKSEFLVANINFFLQDAAGATRLIERLQQAEPPMPLLDLTTTVRTIGGISDLLTRSFAVSFVPPFFAGVKHVLSMLDETSLRHLSKEMVEIIMRYSRRLLRRVYSKEDTGSEVERLYLNIALKCARCEQLERRLNGLVYIQHLLLMARHAKLYPGGIQTLQWPGKNGQVHTQYQRVETACWLTTEYMADWLLKHQIIEDIFVDRHHVQLMKRSAPMLRFLASEGRLSAAMFESIWNASRSAFHDQAVAVTELIGVLASDLPPELLEDLVRRILEIPRAEYDVHLVGLIAKVALSQQFVVPSETPESVAGAKCARQAVTILWEVVTCTEPSEATPEDVTAAALKTLQNEVLKSATLLPLRVEYIDRCVSNIKAHRSVVASLHLLRGILEAYPRFALPPPPPAEGKAEDGTPAESKEESPAPDTQVVILERLDRDADLLNALLADLLSFKATAGDAVSAASPKLDEAGIHALHVAGSTSPYADEISTRLDFIAFALGRSALMLTPEQAELLWDQVVVGGLTSKERSLCLNWFKSACVALASQAAGLDTDVYCTPETITHLFSTRMGDSAFARSLSPEGFLCFEAFFVYVNSLSDKLVRDPAITSLSMTAFQVMDLDLQGTSMLWQIALEAEAETTVAKAVSFLNSLQQRLCDVLRRDIGEYRRSYIARCMENISTAAAEDGDSAATRLDRSLMLLGALLDEAEAVSREAGILPHDPVLGRQINLQLSLNLKKPDGGSVSASKIKYAAYAGERLYDLKAAICRTCGVDMEHCRIFAIGAGELSGAILGRSVGDIGMYDNMVVMALEPKKPAQPKEGEAAPPPPPAPEPTKIEDLPAVILSSNPEYFSILLAILDANKLPLGVLEKVWRLVGRLPTDSSKRSALLGLGSQAVEWDTLLPTSAPFSLFYATQMLERWLTDPAKQSAAAAEVQAGRVVSGVVEGAPGGAVTAAASSAESKETPDAPDDRSVDEADDEDGSESKKDTSAGAQVTERTEEEAAEWQRRTVWQQAFLRHGGFQHLFACLTSDSGPVAMLSNMDASSAPLIKRAAIAVIRLVRHILLAAITVTSPELELQGVSGADCDLLVSDLVAVMTTLPPDDVQALLASVDWSGLQSKLLVSTTYLQNADNSIVAVEELDAQVVSAAISLWVGASLYSRGLWSEVLSMETSPVALFLALLTCSDGSNAVDVRSIMSSSLHTLCSATDPSAADGTSNGVTHPHTYFLKLLLRHLPRPLDGVSSPSATEVTVDDLGVTTEFFSLTAKLLDESCRGRCGGSVAEYGPVLQQLVAQIRSCPIIESRLSDTIDTTLVGTLNLTSVLVAAANPALRENVGSSQEGCGGLINYLFHDCLFALPAKPGAEGEEVESESGGGAGAGAAGAAVADDSSSSVLDQDLPKCKKQESRAAAFQLLSALSRGCPASTTETVAKFTKLIDEFQSPGAWRYNPRLSEKAQCGFVGLRNLGCICYMNAFMQQFFMIKPFRYGVLSAPAAAELASDSASLSDIDSDADTDTPDERKEDVLYQLQQMFGHLYLSERRAYNPAPWCHAYKDETGKPTNYLIQQDAQEYFNVLCDRVETQLRDTPQADLVKSVFSGEHSNQIVCLGGCGDVRTRPETYYNISVQVQNKPNLTSSLEDMIKGEVISDVDCEVCGKKQDINKRQCLNRMNNTLIFHNKRFELNYETFQREKLNDRFEFPLNLDMYPYSTEGVQWRDENEARKKAREASKAAASEGEEEGKADATAAEEAEAEAEEEEEDTPRPYKLHPKEYYEYELVGVVIHMGTAEMGHYFSYIRERGDEPDEIVEKAFAAAEESAAYAKVGVEPGLNMVPAVAEAGQRAEAVRRSKRGQWFEFNDSLVTDFDIKTLPEMAFGGHRTMKRWNAFTSQMVTVDEPISQSAYMLVYERTSPQAPDLPAPAPAPAAAAPAAGAADGAADSDAAASKDKMKVDADAAGAAGAGGSSDPSVLERTTGAMIVTDRHKKPWLPPSIAQQCLEDNISFLHNLHMFGPEFIVFAQQYCQDLGTALPPVMELKYGPDPTNVGLPVIEHLISFGVKVLAHSSIAGTFPRYCTALAPLLRNNVPAAAALLESCLTREELFKDIVFRCNIPSTRRAFCGLLLEAIKVLAPFESTRLLQQQDTDVQRLAQSVNPDDPPQLVTEKVPMGVTMTGRFMDRMVSEAMVDYTMTAWKHFNEFFGLLLEFGKLGRQQRWYLHHRNVAVLLLDMYIGRDSPLYGADKIFKPEFRPRENMGTKQYKPNFSNLLAVVSLLVRCTHTYAMARDGVGMPPTAVIHLDDRDQGIIERHQEAARAAEDARPEGPPASDMLLVSVEGDDALFVPVADAPMLKLLTHKNLFSSAISKNDNPVAIAEIICHVSWSWQAFTDLICASLADGIDKADYDDVVGFFVALEPILGMDDWLRDERYKTMIMGSESVAGTIACMRAFAPRYPRYSYECAHGLTRLGLMHEHVGVYLTHDDDTMMWMEKFLLDYIASPKNAEFKIYLTKAPPVVKPEEAAEFRRQLTLPPQELPIPTEAQICNKLKMPQAARGRRTLELFGVLLERNEKQLLGVEELTRRAEEEAAQLAAAQAAASAADEDDDAADMDSDIDIDAAVEAAVDALAGDDDDDDYVLYSADLD